MSSKQGPLGPIGVLAPSNPILKLIQYSTIENQLNSSILYK